MGAFQFLTVVSDDRFNGDYSIEREILAAAGSDLVVLPSLDDSQWPELAAQADALLANQALINSEQIQRLSRCKIISRYGTGYDNVDFDYAADQGIWVSRVTDYCYNEVAEHALALLLSCARQTAALDRSVRQGQWNAHSSLPIFRIHGKVLGILGYGGTGRSFHHKASGLGFSRVLIHDHRVTEHDIAAGEVEIVDLPKLFQDSDYISIHIPYRKENHHLISEEVLSHMKSTAVLINTSRGSIVDEAALVRAMENGVIGGVGLDVFENEPPLEVASLSVQASGVYTDHAAYYSLESLAELKRKAAENVVRVLAGQEPLDAVNNPAGFS